MNIQGHVEFEGHLDLLDEYFLLDFMGRLGPVIIEADFANSHDLRLRLEPLANLLEAFGRRRRRVFGMNADGGVDLLVLMAQGDGRCRRRHVRTGTHHVFHAGVQGPLNHVFPVFVIRARRNVAVRIEQHQRTRLPGAMPSAKTTCRLPLPSEAAKIMPFDSTPHSFTGFKFVTTTTLLPTRSCGS